MKLKFHKYAACGNDFVIVDEMENALEEPQKLNLGKFLCDRHYSVGCDSVLLVNSKMGTMRIIEKDGSESDMCGTGSTATAMVGRKVFSLEDAINVESKGGSLEILFGKGTILMKGEARKVFEGEAII